MAEVRPVQPAGPRVNYLRSGRYEVLGFPDASPLFRSRAEAEKWMRVAIARLPKGQQPVDRPCMCCGATFESQHIGNRLCGICRHRTDGGSMAIAANSTGKVRRAARA